MLALQRGRVGVACGLAGLYALTSSLAALFLALAGAAWGLGGVRGSAPVGARALPDVDEAALVLLMNQEVVTRAKASHH
jgi:hypothetical protein